MKIVSQNLHHHFESDIYGKLEMLADLIALKDIDIIALQEVGQCYYLQIAHDNIRHGNFIDVLKQILITKYQVEYDGYQEIFCNAYGVRYEQGQGFLVKAKYKVDKFETTQLSRTKQFADWQKRKSISIEIAGIKYINVHLGWTTVEERFEDQVDKLINSIDNSKPFYILGDFNVEPNSKELNYVKNHGLVNLESDETINESSWRDEEEEQRLDYIFSNKREFKIINFIFEEYQISDHKGLLIEI